MSVVNVQIIRPHRTGRQWVAVFITTFLSVALGALGVMLVIPIFSGWSPTYMQSLALVLTTRILLGEQSAYTWWTKAGAR